MLDTLKLSKRLTAAHMPAEQAEALAEELRDGLGELDRVIRDLAVLKWMAGFNIAMTLALLWRVFTHGGA